jgi:phosphohistidine swiveling domain-containing protein
MRSGVDLKIIWKKYAWMRSRDGFARPYKLSELVEHKAQLKPLKHHRYPVIPRPLILLYQQARELVYLRTKRTDVFYELLFWARPIFKEAARNHGLSFQDLKYFSFNSLVLGRPHRYGRNISCLDFDGDFIIIDGPVLTKKTQLEALTDIKGTIAQPGKVRGRVVVVNKVSETIKVKPGNILVTYMTSPDFLPAMKKAVAFVTDEGGLTCHAAIIAREMKKPCVIGTKIATRVLKDGDLVEVDADKGVVRIIKS